MNISSFLGRPAALAALAIPLALSGLLLLGEGAPVERASVPSPEKARSIHPGTSVPVASTGRRTGTVEAHPEGRAGDRVRKAFPEHTETLFGGDRAFARAGEWFALTEDARAPLSMRLPRSGDDSIAFEAGGLTIAVHELGAGGDGAIDGSAVVYAAPGHTSIWNAQGDGFEEWLHLAAGVARDGEVAAWWEVEGASVRQVGQGAEIVDTGGLVRLRVAAPVAYAMGGRAVPVRLEVDGARIGIVVDAGGEEVLVDPSWKLVASMSTARYDHTATLLQSGKVLVAGGSLDMEVLLASVEVYDPTANTWSTVAPLNTARVFHTATELPSGAVLVAGGSVDNGPPTNTVEIYAPAANTWTLIAPMNVGRQSFTATLLPDGTVLAAGAGSAEVFDPAAGTWTPTPPMVLSRTDHTATLLPSGKVLVAGGSFFAACEIYDPAAHTWTAAAAMSASRILHTATLLPSGKVLVVGGENTSNQPLFTAEIYDPAANAWSPAASMSFTASAFTATLLPNGKVLTASKSGGLVYDPATDTWAPTSAMSTDRNNHQATLLPGGFGVLVEGGVDGTDTSLASAEIYIFGVLGDTCSTNANCSSGFCANGVCCNTACAGTCNACSVAAGAAVNGTCSPLSGLPCSDGNACTQGDACQAGTCMSGTAVVCPVGDPDCQVPGTCDSTSGVCSALVAKPDGTTCPTGTCMGGACTPVATSSSSSSSTTSSSGATSSSSTTSSSSGAGGMGSSSTSSSGAGGSTPEGAGGASSSSGTGGLATASGVSPGCSCTTSGSATPGGMGAGLALLLVLGRRRPARRRPA